MNCVDIEHIIHERTDLVFTVSLKNGKTNRKKILSSGKSL